MMCDKDEEKEDLNFENAENASENQEGHDESEPQTIESLYWNREDEISNSGVSNAENQTGNQPAGMDKNGKKEFRMPRYKSEIYAKVIVMVSVVFGIFGVLALVKIIDVENSQTIFAFAVTAVTFVVWKSMLAKSEKQFEALSDLQKNGFAIKGEVTKVELLKSMHYSNQTPYCVHYEYVVNGKTYSGISEFLWEKPLVFEGEEIEIHVDKKDPKIAFSKDFY